MAISGHKSRLDEVPPARLLREPLTHGLRRLANQVRRLVPAGVMTVIPDDLSDELTRDGASELAIIMRGMSLSGMTIVMLLGLDFLRSDVSRLQCALIAGLCLTFKAAIWRATAWLRGPGRSGGGDPNALIDDFRVFTLILGLLWAILLIISMRQAGPAQRDLLYGVAVACMACPVLISPVSCAFTYWLPVTAGALISLFVAKTVDPFTVACLCGFAALTAFSIVSVNRRSAERAVRGVRIERDRRVISLLLRDFEENTSDWLWETNAALELVNVSPRLAAVAQRPAHLLCGVFPFVLLGDAARFEPPGAPQVRQLLHSLEQRSPFRDLVVPVTIKGEARFWQLTGKPAQDRNGAFAGYHGVGSDVTVQLRSQEHIAFLARHDSLTKLPNRVQFGEVLHQACAACDEKGLALICLDLDDFKLVNDTSGHATGDGVLVAVAERIRGCLREGDVAARLGGDEFAILLMTDDIEHAATVAQRLVERGSRPYQFDGQPVQIGISIGIAMAPRDNRTPGGLMKCADLALYRAKADGRGTWRVYDPAMDDRLQESRALQSDLRAAVAKGEFRIDYQPIVDLHDQRIVGVEALLRWQHPERGLLAPGQFIPIAESAGLIGPIGSWVMREACRAAAHWPAHVRVAVNLSPLQFRDPGLIDVIDAALAESGLPPARLELEITETTALETNSHTVDTLWQIHGRGVRIALDDFGTGCSSLSYLRRFPFDKLKIDRSFIRDVGHEKVDAAIIQAIIGLARGMHMTVTAEGVETTEQAELLASYGCAQGQGYLFYQPIGATTIDSAIATDERLFNWTTAYRSNGTDGRSLVHGGVGGWGGGGLAGAFGAAHQQQAGGGGDGGDEQEFIVVDIADDLRLGIDHLVEQGSAGRVAGGEHFGDGAAGLQGAGERGDVLGEDGVLDMGLAVEEGRGDGDPDRAADVADQAELRGSLGPQGLRQGIEGDDLQRHEDEAEAGALHDDGQHHVACGILRRPTHLHQEREGEQDVAEQHQEPGIDLVGEPARDQHGGHGAGAARGHDEAGGGDRIVAEIFQKRRQQGG